ncbi:helix-turn-helix domain-containing protein [Siansivirga zeaxanthinifaciens]|uniref:Transcriptional regulator n=1 Tax=Siansivirga zeaxanthinifaciens CC-SAMT-1 TaxID=1454006 RepID=A0A0C5WAF4_9FLAO|nr:helix-turn-helix transcriptional regulator [Siansivirga zeaxanthinifaciens]AJR02324.1 transcriptional regulator [Siansivirga zeaxanthinifaciens CC-SAMT-1]
MRKKLIFVLLILMTLKAEAQFSFSGHIDNKEWHNNVYLSVIDDYRKISGLYFEQIIAKVNTDSLGYFEFTGNQLENENRIYRIHVDNCFNNQDNKTHFDGYCDDSKEVIFIAKNNDTIVFPFTFDKQMFCDIKSTNEKATVFARVDSLKDVMKFAFSEFRSEANRKLNNKKWFNTLQNFGDQLNEPLADLYIYSFLSDRRNELHEHYLEDLKSNNYYDKLLENLNKVYPNSTYATQYKNELNSDKFIINKVSNSGFNWFYIIVPLLIISVILNVWLLISSKNNKSKQVTETKEQLTKQEQNVLNLLLEDKSNKDIADALFISLSTVKTHINNIYRKLNVQSREETKSLFNS